MKKNKLSKANTILLGFLLLILVINLGKTQEASSQSPLAVVASRSLIQVMGITKVLRQ